MGIKKRGEFFNVRFHLKLTERQYGRIEDAARSNGVLKSEYIRRAVEEALRKDEKILSGEDVG